MGKIDLEILYEDNHIISAIKPAGVLSQADSSGAPDMLTLLKDYIRVKYSKPGNVFCGLVHRLDRPTAGVMVFARTSKGASRLSESIRSGNFDKKYLCVLSGELTEPRGRLIDFLLKDEKTITSKVVPERTEGAKKAVLEYSVLKIKEGFSLVEVSLITGRHHQIRVQFSALGFPVFGDRKYCDYRGKSELALWSSSLSFPHPTKKETVCITASPKDIYPFSIF